MNRLNIITDLIGLHPSYTRAQAIEWAMMNDEEIRQERELAIIKNRLTQ